jgi:hypothetical protein
MSTSDRRPGATHLDGRAIAAAREIELGLGRCRPLDRNHFRDREALAHEPPRHDDERPLGEAPHDLMTSTTAEASAIPSGPRKAHSFTNGDSMPLIGLGTWKSEPGEVYAAVREAIRIGYRHIDCAALYGNEAEIGHALRDATRDGEVTRQDLWTRILRRTTSSSPRPTSNASPHSTEAIA